MERGWFTAVILREVLCASLRLYMLWLQVAFQLTRGKMELIHGPAGLLLPCDDVPVVGESCILVGCLNL